MPLSASQHIFAGLKRTRDQKLSSRLMKWSIDVGYPWLMLLIFLTAHLLYFRFTVIGQYWRPSWLFTLTFFRIVSTLLSQRNTCTWRSP